MLNPGKGLYWPFWISDAGLNRKQKQAKGQQGILNIECYMSNVEGKNKV
jgi:hypothetical protein